MNIKQKAVEICRPIIYNGPIKFIPDKMFLKIRYFFARGRRLNLKNPKTFNEKLQWLKLFDRNPEYTRMVDKYEVRKYISEKIGEEYLIPLIGVWDKVEDIDFVKLPNKFVLKCTHDSQSVVICKDKNNFDKEKSIKKLSKALKRNAYYGSREWAYKNVKPRIIAEKYMTDESGIELKDYKIFCFNGAPKVIEVDFDRFTNHKRHLYDIEWNYIPASIQYPVDPNKIINKPEKLVTMLDLAKILSKDIPHVRVDFYSIYGKIYFGELTFTHGSGYEKFEPKEFGVEMGSWLKLPV